MHNSFVLQKLRTDARLGSSRESIGRQHLRVMSKRVRGVKREREGWRESRWILHPVPGYGDEH